MLAPLVAFITTICLIGYTIIRVIEDVNLHEEVISGNRKLGLDVDFDLLSPWTKGLILLSIISMVLTYCVW